MSSAYVIFPLTAAVEDRFQTLILSPDSVSTNRTHKNKPKSDKAERTGGNMRRTDYALKIQLSEAAVKVIRESEAKTAQGNPSASAGCTLMPSGGATAVENGEFATAKRNLEMLKRAQDSTDCTIHSAQRGVSVLQAYFQQEKAKEEEKAKTRKGSAQRR